jgi:hypothetical protein
MLSVVVESLNHSAFALTDPGARLSRARLFPRWEVVVPDAKGATHIGDLQDELANGKGDRLAYPKIIALRRLPKWSCILRALQRRIYEAHTWRRSGNGFAKLYGTQCTLVDWAVGAVFSWAFLARPQHLERFPHHSDLSGVFDEVLEPNVSVPLLSRSKMGRCEPVQGCDRM